jgi:hypothetical protein
MLRNIARSNKNILDDDVPAAADAQAVFDGVCDFIKRASGKLPYFLSLLFGTI